MEVMSLHPKTSISVGQNHPNSDESGDFQMPTLADDAGHLGITVKDTSSPIGWITPIALAETMYKLS